MQPRTAAIAAVLAGGLAVAVVGLDLAFNLDVHLQEQREGQWSTVASNSDGQYAYEEGFPGGCAGPHLRLVVDNGLPWSKTVRVVVTASNQTSPANDVLLDETWRVEGRDSRQAEFTVPAAALESKDGSPVISSVTVRVDGIYLHTCVEAP